MKLFLDENITLKALEIFRQLGYDVESVQSLGLKGISDEQVFEIAQIQNRILVTHNGKHFIIRIPPRTTDVTHEGLIWLKLQLTRVNAMLVCTNIDNFLKRAGSIANSIWVYNKSSMITRLYP